MVALRFTFRETPLTIKNAKAADANAIGNELHRIAAANDGRLKPRAALDAARSPRNPLHRHIEWRDKVAAEQYRLQQVGELIRIIVREDADDESKPAARAFLSINDKHGTSYRRVDDVLGSSDLQMHVMLAAQRDLRSWENRYSELSEICDLVQVARSRLQRDIEKRTEKKTPPQGEAHT